MTKPTLPYRLRPLLKLKVHCEIFLSLGSTRAKHSVYRYKYLTYICLTEIPHLI